MADHSIWELEMGYEPQDLIIAGSGFAGLWSAYYAKQLRPDWKITIIEKNTWPLGASTRNAGFACFGSLTELAADIRTVGEDAMRATFAMRFEGIRRILSILDPSTIAYEHTGGYELVTPRQYAGPADLLDDMARINALLSPITHLADTFRQAPAKLRRFGFSKVSWLIENTLEGQLHPGKLVSVLSARLQELGVRFLPNTNLVSFEAAGAETIVFTNHQRPFHSRHLLVCTNRPVAEILPAALVMPARGQVIVTAPIPDLAFTGSFHYDEGYYYFRNLGNRVLLGGARNQDFDGEQTDELSLSLPVQTELERFLQETILPGKQYTIEHRWAGIMGMPAGGAPIVKKLASGVYCALGLGGIGVAIAPVIGERAAAMISGDGEDSFSF